jgi:hypothetical protein
LGIDDLAEASRQLDLNVVEAWLVERGSSFNLDSKRLVELAKAGIPSRITDLMIALSYPGVFSIDANAHRGERRGDTVVAYGPGAGPIYPVSSWYGSCDMDYLSFSGSNYCDGFSSGYQYGYGFYQPNYPIIIIYNGSGGGSGGGGGGGGGSSGSRSHGRVVNGGGYQEGQDASADVAVGEPRSSSSTGSSSGAASRPSSPPPPPPPASSGSSGEQRTAKPRP